MVALVTRGEGSCEARLLRLGGDSARGHRAASGELYAGLHAGGVEICIAGERCFCIRASSLRLIEARVRLEIRREGLSGSSTGFCVFTMAIARTVRLALEATLELRGSLLKHFAPEKVFHTR